MLWFWIGLLLIASSDALPTKRPNQKKYDGYAVINVYPKTTSEQIFIHKLSDDVELDFWSETRILGREVQIMIPPHLLLDIYKSLDIRHIQHDVYIPDVQTVIDEERRFMSLQRQTSKKMDFDIDNFNTFDDIITEMDAMAARCPAAQGIICENRVIGMSTEGRIINVLKVSKAGTNRRGYWIDSTIHANEWLAPATLLKIVDLFTTGYGTDQEITALLDVYDFHFLPIMNPDGYVYTHETDRMWRKSRNVNPDSMCLGTDLNRNYDQEWGNAGTNTDPCHRNYGGRAAASEVETQVLQTEIRARGPELDALVSLHTWGQMWLHPYGSVDNITGVCVRAPDHADLIRVANAAADAAENTYGTLWTRGSICETIYPASGTTVDFAKGQAGVKYTFTPELRGSEAPLLPSEITPSFNEIWNAIKAMIAAIEAGKN